MADLKISELDDGGSLQVGDDIPIVRAGNNFRAQVSAGAPTLQGFATTAAASAGTADTGIMNPVLTRNAIEKFAFTSANAATTAQASAGLSDGTFMTPVGTRHAIDKFAFTSANIATSAQATAGTSNGSGHDAERYKKCY
jgi:hypothetical protein